MSSEKAYSVITYFLEVMVIMGISVQIKTDNAPADASSKMKQIFAYLFKAYYKTHHNPTGQAALERSNEALKEMLNKQKGTTKTTRDRLIMLY